jgi:hypothetical protein
MPLRWLYRPLEKLRGVSKSDSFESEGAHLPRKGHLLSVRPTFPDLSWRVRWNDRTVEDLFQKRNKQCGECCSVT